MAGAARSRTTPSFTSLPPWPHGVFVGPAAVFTNDHCPRAINPDGTLKSASDWERVGVTVERGAAIGARAVCVAPVRIGEWASVGAGAVVTSDVAPYALVVGVPARRVGWVGEAGVPLVAADEEPTNEAGDRTWVCPATGRRYVERDGTLSPEAAPASSLGHRTFPINPTTERSPREPSRPRPRGYDEPDLRNNVPRTLHLQQTSPEREARGTFVFVGDEEITCPRRSPCE